MNIVNRLTLRHLKLNKRRTLVTMIGIVISAAMITAVATFTVSFLDLFQQDVIRTQGEWHVLYKNVEKEKVSSIAGDKNTKKLALSRDLGYAVLSGGQNPDKPYLFLRQYDPQAFQTFPVRLTSGRLPQNDGELVVSEHILTNGGVKLAVGDTLTLAVGQRVMEGKTLSQSDRFRGDAGDGESFETLSNRQTRTFTVVGVMERPDYESYSAPGYTVLTYLDANALKPSDPVNVSVTLRHITPGVFKQADQVAQKAGLTPKVTAAEAKDGKAVYDISYNDDLLRYSGVTPYDDVNRTLYTFVGIVTLIIIIGSVSLIHNAFAISISERSRHLGMLASVGATKRQKRRSVYFEGLVVGAVSIPIGILCGIGGIGITFLCVSPLIHQMLDTDMTLRLVVSPLSVIAAAVLSALTIWISILIPAKRASRISPIDAIRQTQDIRLKSKAVKTMKLTRKIFGFEAELALKNIKRNRRRYSATIFSLVISVVLFLTVSAFTKYLQASYSMTDQGVNFDYSVSAGRLSLPKQKALLQKVADSGLADEWSILQMGSGTMRLNVNDFTQTLRKKASLQPEEDGTYGCSLILVGLDAASFRSYAEKLGLDAESFSKGSGFSGILINTAKIRNKTKFVQTEILDVKPGKSLHFAYDGAEGDPKYTEDVRIAATTDQPPTGVTIASENYTQVILVLPQTQLDQMVVKIPENYTHFSVMFAANTHQADRMDTFVNQLEKENPASGIYAWNLAKSRAQQERLTLLLSVFAYGFIVLITCICVANIVNTISTSISLRKREFAMLKSVGMTPKGFNRMINFESLFYGIKAVLYGLPVSVVVIWLMYKALELNFAFPFTLPWLSIGFAVAAVFLLVSLIMLYSSAKVKKENIIEGLRQENS